MRKPHGTPGIHVSKRIYHISFSQRLWLIWTFLVMGFDTVLMWTGQGTPAVLYAAMVGIAVLGALSLIILPRTTIRITVDVPPDMAREAQAAQAIQREAERRLHDLIREAERDSGQESERGGSSHV